VKRTVKAWALFWKGEPLLYKRSPFWAAFPNRAAAIRNGFNENVVRPVTVTYDDGRKAKKRRKK
jgi:hypothetical protein